VEAFARRIAGLVVDVADDDASTLADEAVDRSAPDPEPPPVTSATRSTNLGALSLVAAVSIDPFLISGVSRVTSSKAAGLPRPRGL
jgi:hypothetical protein